ncbi:Glutamyl-tRNA synthetase [Emiliania huxleyi CCMP1516]|uniref:Glutamate--tRNA ligase n=2 Tax=Emiliania huxleyi TaxID=2903 RepID=A0A0D3IW95_EMIH1|nr:Glutamyl-tRNA synthetase [Emiliania huxleyi CCMP1516]EOD15530.1 Glutamyl-tRNA synthetase [Emiliania huxleyi CCMP1516]|eukprot:XP_005767959.1 Glutamyl-tRNA synthetase [Emiliania huxleyi CCMP1516]
MWMVTLLSTLGYGVARGALPRGPAAAAVRGLARGRGSRMCAAAGSEPGARTRFAPSPTGSLHVGGARTALYSWLWARQNGGQFLLRVEDTDTARSTRESEDEVLADLAWLGLVHDEGPTAGGPHGPYRQSERMQGGLYQELAQKLLDSGAAYRCFCTPEELDAKRAAAEAAGENPQYDGTWRDADPAEVQRRLDAGEPYTVRFRVPDGKVVGIEDAVRGRVEWDVQATVGDFILLRSGGMPVYNFCVAVDDADMKVSTVIRAEEHLTNTVRQVLILEALGFPLPRFAHLSLVLGEGPARALPGGQLRAHQSRGVFDLKKLNWINGQHLRALAEEERAALVGRHLAEAGVAMAADSPFSLSASRMVAEKIELVNDASPLVRDALAYPLADSLASSGAQKLADELRRVGGALVAAHREGVLPDGASPDFEAEWKSAVKSFGKELGLKGKSLFMPLRLAVTGRMAGPDVGAQLQLLALAPDGAKCESVPLDARMAQLEAALADMPVPVEA